jgi:hypothetical protein
MTTRNTLLRGVLSCSLIEVYLVFSAKYCKENSVPIGSLTAPTLPRALPHFKIFTFSAFSLLVRVNLRPQRWKEYVPPKRRLNSTRLHGVTAYKIVLFDQSSFIL